MKISPVWMLLILTFLFSRFYNLGNLPLFSDEGYAVSRAWELRDTGELLGMVKYTTQPVFIWLIAIFQFLPLNNIVSGRLVSGIFGLGTALIISKLAGKWINNQAKIPAFILMTVLPFSMFYDRTILFESVTLFFMVLAIVFPLVTGLAILTKQTGWLIFPLVLALGKGRLKDRFAKIFISILAVFAVWYFASGGNYSVVESIIGKTAVPVSASANFKNNLLRSKLWLIDYLTWPVIWLSVLGGIAAVAGAIRQKKITPILIVAGWTLGVFLFINKTAVIFYPRYLYSIIFGVVLLAVNGWEIVRKTLSNKMVLSGLFILVLLPGTISDWKIIAAPQTAEIPREDGFQFFEDWTSGIGAKEMIRFIESRGSHPLYEGCDPSCGKTTIFFEEENSYYVSLLSNSNLKDKIIVKTANWLQDPLGEIVKDALEDNYESLFIRNRHPDIPDNWPAELVWSYPKTDKRSVYLYKIIK